MAKNATQRTRRMKQHPATVETVPIVAVHTPGGPQGTFEVNSAGAYVGNSGNEVWRVASFRLVDSARARVVDISTPARRAAWAAARPPRAALLLATANLLHPNAPADDFWAQELMDATSAVNESTVMVGLGMQSDLLVPRARHVVDIPSPRKLEALRTTRVYTTPSQHRLTQQQRRLLTQILRSRPAHVEDDGPGSVEQQQQEQQQQQQHAAATARIGAIAVRGDFTAAALACHGIRAHSLGCPSLFLNTRPRLGLLLEARHRAIARRLLAVDSDGERLAATAAQEPASARFHLVVVFGNCHVAAPPPNLNRLLVNAPRTFGLDARRGDVLTAIVQDDRDVRWVASRLARSPQWAGTAAVPRLFSNVSAWIDAVSSADLVLSARIHGSAIGLAAGVPTFNLLTDMRQSEFVERMGLLGVDVFHSAAANETALRHAIVAHAGAFDGRRFDRNRATLARGYARLFAAAGIPLNPAIAALGTPSRRGHHEAGHASEATTSPSDGGDTARTIASAASDVEPLTTLRDWSTDSLSQRPPWCGLTRQCGEGLPRVCSV